MKGLFSAPWTCSVLPLARRRLLRRLRLAVAERQERRPALSRDAHTLADLGADSIQRHGERIDAGRDVVDGQGQLSEQVHAVLLSFVALSVMWRRLKAPVAGPDGACI